MSSLNEMRRSGGQAVITAVVFFMVIATTIGMAVINPVLRQVKQADDFARTRGDFFVSQSINEDALYRVKTGKKFVSPSTLTLNGYSATATSTSVVGGIQINSSSNGYGLVRNIQSHLTSGSGTSFNYGVQSGTGGIIFENSSSISGNVYSNGAITATGGNIIRGDVVSAGPAGLINGVHATSSAYAHAIQNATIDKDAYYATISGSAVHGASHPNSPDQATSSLPISDAQVASWEADAAAGGVISSPCPYKTGNTATLGPVKINCDLEIDGDTVTLKGLVWVAGKIEIDNSATVKIDPSLGKKSVMMIADNSSNQTDSSTIELKNSTEFKDSGTAGSYILLISQNKSAETGGGKQAITAGNSVKGKVLLYAGHGEIELQNSVSLKEVTAYRLRLQNSSEVIYETGLANLLFTSGPSGGYVFDKWREVQ